MVHSRQGTSPSRFICIKTSLDDAGWQQEYRAVLEELVINVHTITKHAFSFTKFIFLREFQANMNFEIYNYVNDKKFF
ncbi:uncharacterized protein BX664DRAFT_270742, partial [Halteromyces radiatus]|uniref:uncharacterized protein n=1 Tax=Halteromyces radiatus TaxID=101107 RepID=UPI00221FBC45